MFNTIKRNKKRGFTLIELIIVIAIIAILAAIAVPAFGQIREKANVSSDLGTARTIYSVITAGVADESIILPPSGNMTYYDLTNVGTSGDFNTEDATPGVTAPKAYQNSEFFVGLDTNGNVEIVVGTALASGAVTNAQEVYPNGTGRYEQGSN